MAKPGRTGLVRIFYAAGYSFKGLAAAWKHEAAFRQEILLCVLLTPVAFWLAQTGVERALLIGFLWLIVVVEVINSAIEAIVDRFGDEWHELSGRAKDLGSAAVFLTFVLAVAVWLLVLIR